MKGKILVTPRAFAKSGMEQIQMMREAGWEVHVNETGKSYTYEEFLDYAKDVDGIIIGVDKANRDMLDKCTNLKAIAKYGVGVDNIDMEAAKEKGIRISRAIGSNSVSVAEHTIALMFALSKNIYVASKQVKNGSWNKPYGFEVNDKTIGIIGFGNIGKNVARMVQGLNMKVMAFDAFPIDETYANTNNIQISTFDEIVENADVITLHLPLTEETKNMFHLDVMKKMKPTSILINAARGGIVNEADLYTALLTKEIAGAGFDVYSTEPPMANDPLLQLDNFVLTPHTASKTKEADTNTIRLSVQNILRDLEESK